MKPLPKVRLHLVLSPGAASRLRALAAAEGTDVSGMVEFLVRSSKRKVEVPRAAPLPPVAPEPEEEPDPFPGEETIGGILTGKTFWTPDPAPEPALRDPLAEYAPAWVRNYAEAVRDKDPGILASDRAALKAWMLGDDEVDRRRCDTEVPPAPTLMGEAESVVLDQATRVVTVNHDPMPPAAPPKPLRDYSAPDAPAWVRRIVGALADGLDAIVPEEAMESLRGWRRGEDVGEPNLSNLTDEE